MDALRAEIKQFFVQICTISRHRRCIRYLILLTVKEFGLPLGEILFLRFLRFQRELFLLADVIMSRRKRG